MAEELQPLHEYWMVSVHYNKQKNRKVTPSNYTSFKSIKTKTLKCTHKSRRKKAAERLANGHHEVAVVFR